MDDQGTAYFQKIDYTTVFVHETMGIVYRQKLKYAINFGPGHFGDLPASQIFGVKPSKTSRSTVKVWNLGVLYILVSETLPVSKGEKCGMELKQLILQTNYIYYPQLFDKTHHRPRTSLTIASEQKLFIRNPEWLKDDEL